MTTLEANKIIAEYMGVDLPVYDLIWGDGTKAKPIHSLIYNSLDTLVPVWEKIRKEDNGVVDMSLRLFGRGQPLEAHLWVDDVLIHSVWASAATIQEAAAMATAGAIQELEK